MGDQAILLEASWKKKRRCEGSQGEEEQSADSNRVIKCDVADRAVMMKKREKVEQGDTLQGQWKRGDEKLNFNFYSNTCLIIV